MIFNACVELLHQTPSQALKGMSMDDLRELLDMYREQGKAIEEARQS